MSMHEALILAGPGNRLDTLCAEAAGGACILLDPDETELHAAHDLVQELSSLAGTRLYVPPALAAYAPDASVLTGCGPFGGPLAGRLRRHRDQWGSRAAALIRPCSAQAVISDGGAVLSRAQTVLPAPARGALYSDGCCCAYLVRRTDGGWQFSLFDTERSIRKKAALCRSLQLTYFILL